MWTWKGFLYEAYSILPTTPRIRVLSFMKTRSACELLLRGNRFASSLTVTLGFRIRVGRIR